MRMGAIILAMGLLTGGTALADDQNLQGLSEQQVVDKLGAPGLKRTEHPGHFWQYANERCVLNVYLYEPDLGGEAKVDYAEARMRTDDPPSMSPDKVSDCLKVLD